MKHYYESEEFVYFKSDFKKVKKLPNMKVWVECDDGPRYANPSRTSFRVRLMFERLDNIIHEMGQAIGKPITSTAHVIVNGVDYLENHSRFLAEDGGSVSVCGTHFQEYDISTKEKRTITVSAYIESANNIYDFGEINFTFELPEVPEPATLTVPSTITVGEPFSVTVNPNLGFCNYLVQYRLPEYDGYHGSISDGWDAKTLYVCNDFTLDLDRYGFSNFYKN